MKTKFEIQELLGIGLTLVVLGIGIAYGLQVMGDIEDDMKEDDCTDDYEHYNSSAQICYKCPNATWNNYYPELNNQCRNSTAASGDNTTASISGESTETNATQSGIEGVAKIPEKIPTIATVVVASVIIGILVTYLWGRFQ